MASSPEQEIPQEIVEKAARVLDVRANGEEKVARRDVYDHWRDYARLALVAVLPDLQRPLLKEIERLRVLADAYGEERDQAREAVRANADLALQMIAERDARPDLTAEEIRALLGDPGNDDPGIIEAAASARAKLEKSLDAAG